MFENEKVETIRFHNKYVSGQALEVLTDFTQNSYIVKGSTGIGGTTALLNYTKGNCIIVSPNTGMIIDKSKGNYQSDKQAFIYANSLDSWETVNNYLIFTDADKQNIIVNCTPDQILKLRSENRTLYNEITKPPIFIDEYHAYTTTSDFRNVMGVFLELVYNEWIGSFKLSTATANYLNLDVFNSNVKYYNLIRNTQQKKTIQLSYNARDVKEFVEVENSKGRTVVMFTNDKKYHTSNKFKNVKNLVGKNLAIKIAPYNRVNNINDEKMTDCDLLVCSSAYFAGFDINKDVSICIISNQSNDSFKIGVNDVVQCYGRCRNTVLNALFVNIKSNYNHTTKKPTTFPKSIAEINHAIRTYEQRVSETNQFINDKSFYSEVEHLTAVTKQMHTNRALLLQPVLDKVLNYQLYNGNVLLDTLESYGFIVTNYIIGNIDLPTLDNKTPFKERLVNLLKLDSIQLLNHYKTAKYNLKTKNDGSFSTKLTFELLTAYLLKITDADLVQKLTNKRLFANEFYKSLDLFLRSNVDTRYYYENLSAQQQKNAQRLYQNSYVTEILKDNIYTTDWQYMYSNYKIINNVLPSVIEREIKLYEFFYNADFYKPLVSNKNQRNRNVKIIITNKLNECNISLTADETEWLNDVSKMVFKEIDSKKEYVNHNTRNTIKNKMKNVLLYMLTNGKIGTVTEVKNRQYNPLTQIPKALRCILPIKLVSVDLTSANPQIVNNILNTNIGLSVYQNLMDNRNVNRNKAKKIYNSCLNNHFKNVSDAKKVYLDCGYTKENATKLAKLTAKVEQGSFYEVMTANEKILMENYANILPFKSFRFHDAIITTLENIESNNVVLPTNVQGYIYHAEIFNDSTVFNGITTNKPHVNEQFVNNYVKFAS